MGMNFAQARHLMFRVGLGATPANINRLRNQGADVYIQIQVSNLDQKVRASWPSWSAEPIKVLSLDAEANRMEELRAWWFRELLTTDAPLIEHMVLFWHGLFGIPFSRVRSAQLMARHHRTIRQHATGNFRQLLLAVLNSPAALLHLDANQSSRKIPATALAQALLTRFTLPPGTATPADIEAAAAAFTGWHLNTKTWKPVFHPRKHDKGTRTFLGHTGAFDAENVLKILLEDSRVAEHIVAELWKRFISSNPDPSKISALSTVLIDADYEIKPLLEELLGSPDFLGATHHQRLLRDPVHCIVGTARSFYLTQTDPYALAAACRALGQDLFEPPPDKAWPYGRSWFLTNTLEQRRHAISSLLRGAGPRGTPAIPDEQAFSRWLGRPGLTGVRAQREAARVLLGGPPLRPVPAKADPHTMMLHLAMDPQYQLM